MVPFGLNDPALRGGVHGAACALFLMLAGLLWRDGSGTPIARVSAALAASAAAGALSSAPGFQHGAAGLRVPILALSWGTPAVFWLWTRAGFGEQFRFRRWHALPWVVMAGAGLVATYTGGTATVLAAILALGFAALAVVETVITWRADLVAQRRRLRIFVAAGTVALIVTNSAADLRTPRRPQAAYDVRGLALLVLAAVASLRLLRTSRPEAVAALLTPAPAVTASQAAPPDPALLSRLKRLMIDERAYREEGLTSGALAARLGVPEHRLRHAINQGLGQRNFNAFVNRYRIDDAKAALADPSQRAVPILTIAMDAGFQSLGPFNRAFKADTGQTPTEYRRGALAD